MARKFKGFSFVETSEFYQPCGYVDAKNIGKQMK